MLAKLFRKRNRKELQDAYEAGVSTGYNLGYRLGQTEKDTRGFIIGSRMDWEIEEILKEKE